LLSTKEIIEKYGLLCNKSYSKRLGQNFLIDETVPKRIIESFKQLFKANHGASSSEVVLLEIGSGAGSLTRELLQCSDFFANDLRVIAIEKDEECIKALSEFKYLCDDRFLIIKGDALDVKISDLVLKHDIRGSIHIISNLPYNIGTVLLCRWLKEKSPVQSMTLMLQKEVVDTILADCTSKDFGRLSILTSYFCKKIKLFDVPPSCFIPSPKVMSSVVSLWKKKDADIQLTDSLEKITQFCFSKRRKMIRNSIKYLFDEPTWKDLQAKNHFLETDRPEDISIDAFINIAKTFQSLNT
jgi:16S rRNA (adenine1518-N6/adenine1519-N6)-dimethyltransferase